MNDLATKADISRLESEVMSLKSLIIRFFENKNMATKTQNINLDTSEPSEDEMMLMTAHTFNVTSEYDEDDDNIADPNNIKPIDRSRYV
ncbi:MAG: hypothetical protein KatS3mg087_0866 [Patescibacteria group bacterium]|nr:MAG: hypothetical protein KatS3mg087_0866 [Patescibacteria group bacterium]